MPTVLSFDLDCSHLPGVQHQQGDWCASSLLLGNKLQGILSELFCLGQQIARDSATMSGQSEHSGDYWVIQSEVGHRLPPHCISVELPRTYNWTHAFMLTTKNRWNSIRWTQRTWWYWILKKLDAQIGELPPSPLLQFGTAEWCIKVWLITTNRSSKVQFGYPHSPCQGQLLSLRPVKDIQAEDVTFSAS